MSPALSTILAGYRDRLEAVAQESAGEMSRRVVGRTPVDTASAAQSWNPNIGAPVARNVDAVGGDIGPVLSAIRRATGSLRVGSDYSMANGKPYIRRLEYGWSQRQAPGGMLRISVAEWNEIVDSSVRAARGG